MKNISPILLAIGGGVIYHVAQKTMPKQVDPFAAIILAYAVGIACCAVAWVLMPSSRSWLHSWRASTVAVIMLGMGAAPIENPYRLTWRFSIKGRQRGRLCRAFLNQRQPRTAQDARLALRPSVSPKFQLTAARMADS